MSAAWIRTRAGACDMAEDMIYFGQQVWPPSGLLNPDAPDTPDLETARQLYWLFEEMHRTLTANGMSDGSAAITIRNWSKYIAAVTKPQAARSIAAIMAQGLDLNERYPGRELHLRNTMPMRPIKYAKKR